MMGHIAAPAVATNGASIQALHGVEPLLLSTGKEVSRCSGGMGSCHKARFLRISRFLLRGRFSFATYRLQGDAKSWWETTHEVRYTPDERRTLTWEEFTSVFIDTDFPPERARS